MKVRRSPVVAALALYPFMTLGVLASCFFLACGGDGTGESMSAGGEPSEWVLSSELVLVLGGVDGHGPEEFGALSGAAWMTDGSILVADPMAGQIRQFASDGTHLSTVGRKGSGPGEFEVVAGVLVGPGDTIWGYDNQARHISSFYGGEHHRDLEIYRGEPVGWVADRVIAVGIPLLNRGPEPRSPGLHRDPWRVVAHAADGSAADTLIRGLSEELFLSEDRIWGSPILKREPYFALGSGFVAYGDGESRDVIVVDLMGDTLVTIPVAEISGDPLDELASARREARVLEFPPERRPRVRTVQATIPLPEWIADVSDLAVDSDDLIWVRRVFTPVDSLVTWDVYDRHGSRLAWIQTPVRLVVREIRSDKLLATDRDVFDVARLLVYRIEK